jgi:outer membrane protein assembly factor BamB
MKLLSTHRQIQQRRRTAAVWLCILIPWTAQADEKSADRFWPQWRGPLSTGVAPHANPPIEWSENKNVRWKTPLSGTGHSTPIIWGDRVFVTTAVPFGNKLIPKPDTAPGAHDNSLVTQRHHYVVLCINRSDGAILWQQTMHSNLPHEGGHNTGSLASASPVTDGERVIAYFGSHGLYCLDYTGKLLWKKDLGDMQSKHAHGEGTSPVLHGNTLVVNWDHEAQSFIAAFDTRTGRQLWRLNRDEVTSWASPIVYEHNGQPQLIVSGTGRVRGYELSTGKVLWECGGLSHNVVASPVAADGMVFAASSYETRAMFAIRLDGARGDITDSQQVVWKRHERTPYVPSPLLYGDSIYFLRHYQGILSRVTAKTGEEPLGPFRLGGIIDVYASPVGAAGRVYVTDRRGSTMVIGHSDNPRLLALNRLDDQFSASAAMVDGELFLRGEKFLYCLAED